MLSKKFIEILALLSLVLVACVGAGDIQSLVTGQQRSNQAQLQGNIGNANANNAAFTRASVEGYTLFTPLMSTITYLIDNDGQIVHSWQTSASPGNASYLLESGNLLYTSNVRSNVFNAGGSGGRVEEYSWDGDLLWSFDYASNTYNLHHDIERLSNGNVLMIAWEYKTTQEMLAVGRDAELIPDDNALWPDHIIEVNPEYNQIVWEWHVWDHLVQDSDASKPNYGPSSATPGRVDINYISGRLVSNDWNHINSIDYNAELDQILLSVHSFSEIWVIDHSTTSAQAATNSGGNSGVGGDLLYRWGNPSAYGTAGEQQLYAQHDAEWIESGLPGAGNILIFNNGDQRDQAYSSIVEIVPPRDAAGNYSLASDSPFGPGAPVWEYVANPASSFYARNLSGSQRLSNGNTLICDGNAGRFFEVTPAGELVWEYTIPSITDGAGVSVFRAERYYGDYLGLAGRDLSPSGTVAAQAGPPNGGGPGGGGPGGGGGGNAGPSGGGGRPGGGGAPGG